MVKTVRRGRRSVQDAGVSRLADKPTVIETIIYPSIAQEWHRGGAVAADPIEIAP